MLGCAREIKFDIISGSNQEKMIEKWSRWKQVKPNAQIIDFRTTEVDDNYTLWICYKE